MLGQRFQVLILCLRKSPKKLGPLLDDNTFVGNCPPTPPLSQNVALSEKETVAIPKCSLRIVIFGIQLMRKHVLALQKDRK